MATSFNPDDIYRGIVVFTMQIILKYVLNGSILLDPEVQRRHVSTHPSSPDLLLDSMAGNIPTGMLTGYMHGEPPTNSVSLTGTDFLTNLRPTPAKPFYLTDYGHRLRFLISIAADRATYDGYTLAQMQSEKPSIYERIMATTVPMDIAFHKSGIVPHAYIAKMFTRLQLSAPASVGEKGKASADTRHADIVNSFMASIATHRSIPSDRDIGRATAIALSRGAYNPEKMSTKEKDVIDETPLTDEQAVVSRAQTTRFVEIMAAIGQRLESQILNCQQVITDAETAITNEKAAGDARVSQAHGKEAKTLAKAATKTSIDRLKEAVKEAKKNKTVAEVAKTRFATTDLDLALDGPLMFGLYTDPLTAGEMIVNWFVAATKSKESWKTMSPEVMKAAKNSATRSFELARWRNSWNAVLKFNNALPAFRDDAVDSVSIPISVASE